MILRIKRYRLSLKIAIYALPLLVSSIGWCVWMFVSMALRRPALYAPGGHFTQIAFGTVVWAFLAEHYRVTSFDELFHERTGARAAWSACVATASVLLATLYFSRNATFPRGLLICDMILLLAFTILLHAVFRILCRSRANFAKPTRLLVIGADEFAHEAAAKLKRLSFAPCAIAGYVHLPGQETFVNGDRIYELEQLGMINSGHGIDEAVIAIHPAQFAQIPKILKALDHLCIPAKAVVDLGDGIVVREKLFQLGNVQMLDLTSTPDGIARLCSTQTGFRYLFRRNCLAACGSPIRTDRGDHSVDVAWSDIVQAGAGRT